MKSATMPAIAADDSARAGQAPSERRALASLSLSMLLAALGTSIANVGLPSLAKSFEASFQSVQWIVIAYLLAITSVIVSVGRLGDVIGRRRLLLGGLALFTLASVLCGVAPTLGLLIVARVAQGLGAAIMMALTLAFVAQTVPKERIGSAMGLLGTMSALGTALGPSLGGLLIANLGWRSIFLVNLPLGLLTLVLAYRHLPLDRPSSRSEGGGFDLPGTLLLALTLLAYALAMTLGRGHFGPLNQALLLAALAGAGLFAWVETRVATPLIRLALFRDRVLSAGLAMSALVTSVMMATLVIGPFYLSGALALDAMRVGLVMACGPVVAALVGVPAGRLVDRFGSQWTTIAGLVAMAVGSATLTLVSTRLGVPGYLAPLSLITAGYALFQAANNAAVMAEVHSEQRGVVSGMLNLARNLGLVSGASAMGAVFAFGTASVDTATAPAAALAAGMHLCFAVAAALVLVALAIAVASSAQARRARSRG